MRTCVCDLGGAGTEPGGLALIALFDTHSLSEAAGVLSRWLAR